MGNFSSAGKRRGLTKVNRILSDYYRVPAEALGCITTIADCPSKEIGFFRFGTNNVCYGRCKAGVAADAVGSGQFDASRDVQISGTTVRLPFNIADVVDNLRLERYRQRVMLRRESLTTSKPVHRLYYFLREALPVSARRYLQKIYFSEWRKLPFPAWPVDSTVDTLHADFLRLLMDATGLKKVPFIWFWPEGAPSCFIMTHDVETPAGRDATSQLMDLDDAYGVKASFQVIPEGRYEVHDEYVCEIRSRGFEFNIHDLSHDGSLYHNQAEFERRAARINSYARRYNAQGFRAGLMCRNQDWYDAFDFSYDMSVPNVAHLEPMRGGCCTVMPYFVGKIVELPLTTAQDYSLFHILNDYSIDLWKQQLALIRARNGLMSFIAHPDYLLERRPRTLYQSLLDHLRQMMARDKIWNALPGEVDQWWRARSQMKLIHRNGQWKIEGDQSERARIAYAVLEGDQLAYEVPSAHVCEGVRL
jgi:hypothetical protein